MGFHIIGICSAMGTLQVGELWINSNAGHSAGKTTAYPDTTYKGHVGPAQWKGGDWAGSKKRE